MGYYTEVNTLVRLPKDFDVSTLSVGQLISITHERERIVPLHIAVLLIDTDWNFYGYCRVNSMLVKAQTTSLEVEVISIFNPQEQKLYRDKFVEAATTTGEIK